MRVNVYIRKENEEEWSSIENKSVWVNERLGVSELRSERKTPLPRVFPTIKSFTEVVAGDMPVPSVERLQNGLCKIHGTPLTDNGKCLQKGCKYS